MSCERPGFFGSIIDAAADEAERQIQLLFADKLRGTGFDICMHVFGPWSTPVVRSVHEHDVCASITRIVGQEQVSHRTCRYCSHEEHRVQALQTPEWVDVPWYDRNRVALMDEFRQPLDMKAK